MTLTAKYIEQTEAHIPYIEINHVDGGNRDEMDDPLFDHLEIYPLYISLEGIIDDDRRAEAVLFAQKMCEEHGSVLSQSELKNEIQGRIEDLKKEEEIEKEGALGEYQRSKRKGDTLVGFPPRW